jgi:hypothetical protein
MTMGFDEPWHDRHAFGIDDLGSSNRAGRCGHGDNLSVTYNDTAAFDDTAAAVEDSGIGNDQTLRSGRLCDASAPG